MFWKRTHKREIKPYIKNAEGDFYVEDGCCTLCGMPEQEAPALFQNDEEHCYVSKQPANEIEVQQMMNAIKCAELSCIRYKGVDKKILGKLIAINERDICDNLK